MINSKQGLAHSVTPDNLKEAAMEFLGVGPNDFNKLAHEYMPKSYELWDEINPKCFCDLAKFYNGIGKYHLASQVQFAMVTWDSRANSLMTRANSVLDYGCGIGVSTLWCALQGAKEVYLCDYDTLSLEFAKWWHMRHGITPEVIKVTGPLMKLPTVDMIVCIEVIEHLTNPIEMLFEFHRAAGNLWITHLLVDPEVEKKDPFREHLGILPGANQMIPIMNAIGYQQSPAHPLLWLRAWNNR